MDDAYIFVDEILISSTPNPNPTQTFSSTQTSSSSPTSSSTSVTHVTIPSSSSILSIDDAYTYSSSSLLSLSSSSSSLLFQMSISDYIWSLFIHYFYLVLFVFCVFLFVYLWKRHKDSKAAANHLSNLTLDSMDKSSRGFLTIKDLIKNNTITHISSSDWSTFIITQCSVRINSLTKQLEQLEYQINVITNYKESFPTNDDKNNEINEIQEDSFGILYCANKDEQVLDLLSDNNTRLMNKKAILELETLETYILYCKERVDNLMTNLSNTMSNLDDEQIEEHILISKLERSIQIAKKEEFNELSSQFKTRVETIQQTHEWIFSITKLCDSIEVAMKCMMSINVNDWKDIQEDFIITEARNRYRQFENSKQELEVKIKECKLVLPIRISLLSKKMISTLNSILNRADKALKGANGMSIERVELKAKGIVWRWKKIEELKIAYTNLRVNFNDRGRFTDPVFLGNRPSNSSLVRLLDNDTMRDKNNNAMISIILDENTSSQSLQNTQEGSGAGSIVLYGEQASFQDQEAAIATWLSSSSSSSSLTDTYNTGHLQQALSVLRLLQEQEHRELEFHATLAASRQNSNQITEQIDASALLTVTTLDANNKNLVQTLSILQKESQKAAQNDIQRIDEKEALEEAQKELEKKKENAQNNVSSCYSILFRGFFWMLLFYLIIISLSMSIDILEPYYKLFRHYPKCSFISTNDSSVTYMNERKSNINTAYSGITRVLSLISTLSGARQFTCIVSWLSYLKTIFSEFFLYILAFWVLGGIVGNKVLLICIGLYKLLPVLFLLNLQSEMLFGFFLSFFFILPISWSLVVCRPFEEDLKETMEEKGKQWLLERSKSILEEKRILHTKLSNEKNTLIGDKRTSLGQSTTPSSSSSLSSIMRREKRSIRLFNQTTNTNDSKGRITLFFLICVILGILSGILGIGVEKSIEMTSKTVGIIKTLFTR